MIKEEQRRNVNLNEVPNDNCKQCSKDDRPDNSLCNITKSVIDDLPVRCVGGWAYEKIYRLIKYYGIFVQGMKNKWKGKLNYIEICSGPGRCIFRKDKQEVDGTALAIVKNKNTAILNKAIFIDNEKAVVETLNARIKNEGKENVAAAILGDYLNERSINDFLSRVPKGCLNLVFVDPTECNVPFQVIRKISDTLENVDLIINVAVGTDIGRNLANSIINESFKKVRNKYESFLGNEQFFKDKDIIQLAKNGEHERLREAFRKAYKDQLGLLGYKYIDEKRVKHFYSLFFVSKNERGLSFWEKANIYEPSGQKTLF